jgi:hypothetical protein
MMLTRKLNQAHKVTEKLVHFLSKREWHTSPELCAILERADKEVERIQDKAIADVLVKLQGSYIEEAKMWADNKDSKRFEKLTKAEQAKAKTELKRIQKTITDLYEVL